MSLLVSVAAQKNGGDSDHPICKPCGMTTSMSLSSDFCFVGGSTYAKFHASNLLTTIRQNPSLISHLENMNGRLVS